MGAKLFFFLPLFLFSSCFPQTIHTLSGQTMGTGYQIQYHHPSLGPQSLAPLVEQTLKEVNRQMSTYQKDSEISRFNASSSLDWFPISADFYTVLKHSLELAHKTGGIYDPTIGPLVNLWGFGPTGEKKVPSPQQIQQARTQVGHQKIELLPSKIRKKVPGMQLDLSASAKGMAVDKVARLLEEHAVENYLVEIGGEMKAKGHKQKGQSWRVAIETPNETPGPLQNPYHKILPLFNQAIATSGDYRHFFEEKGKKYSHTLDYRTGRPIQHHLASVTVVDPFSCLNADALATTLMAMGPDRGLEFAEREKLAAYFIYRKKGVFIGRGSTHFNQLSKP